MAKNLDFSKLAATSVADELQDPSRIFAALPNNKLQYLRDVQGQVLEQWYERRAEKDIAIKMNTGAGKTVVGLLILKSCLNGDVKPAVYLTADSYLAEQVVAEAARLGLETVTEPDSPRFTAGRAILVINVYRLINGRSVFGVRSRRRPIGALLVDDAHACSTVAEEQFSIRLKRSHPAWQSLFKIFESDLKQQAQATTLGIRDGDPRGILEVPFWAWRGHQDQVAEILHGIRDEDEFGFHWPLISDVLAECRAIFTGMELQVVPSCLPVSVLPTMVDAPRRVFMTATLPDDGVLVEDFGASPELLGRPITPKTAGDLGDRMIMAPQETHPGATEDELRSLVVEFAETVNVVVIVPSARRAEVWKPVASLVLAKESLAEGLARLTREHVGLAVLVNRYDGVDLPGTACRMLVIDGVPEAYSPMERLEAAVVAEDEVMTRKQIQRIEQGMGRGVRANDDFCVVLLLGSRLAQHLHAPGGKSVFSPGTRAQMELSARLAEQLEAQPLSALGEAASQCLQRNEAWVTASRNAVVGASYPGDLAVSDITVRRREAFDLACRGEYRQAEQRLQEVIATTGDRRLRGWMKQEAASYLHGSDPIAAQQLQRSAVEDNHALTRPLGGIVYQRLSEPAMAQSLLCSSFLSENYADGNSLLVKMESILASLQFVPDSASEFEASMCDLARHIGLGSQRPEHETGSGPDVLWALGQLRYAVIECKNESSGDIPKRDAAQLGNSVDWFKSKYDHSCSVTPVLVHPTGRLRRDTVATLGSVVVDSDRLKRLCEAVRGFGGAVSQGQQYRSAEAVGRQLTAFQLMGASILDSYTVGLKSGT